MSEHGPHADDEGALATIADLAASISAGETDLLVRHFQAHDGDVPTLVWSPRRSQLGNPVLQGFRDVCDQIDPTDGPLRQADVRIDDFDGLERWMMVLAAEDDGFRYIHYGEEIANHYGADMTGRSTADFEDYIGTFFAAVYSAAAERRERALSVHEPPARVFVRAWRRFIVPLLDDAGNVSGFVAANVAENELRVGLDMIVDPVFVTDADGAVQYFNESAQAFFGIRPGQRRAFHEITGLEFPELPPPELLLTRRDVVERMELVARPGGVMDRLAVSVSAASHRGRAFYVIQIRDFPAA